MTSQTKKFVELSDIIGLRIECGHCGSTVITPVLSFENTPQRCSNCGTPFVGLDSPRAVADSLGSLISAFKTVQRIADHYKFKFSVEIADPKQITSPSDAT